MRFSKNLFFTFLLWVIIASVNSFAQIFPVSVNLTLIQPNSVYLSDYTTTNAENLRVTLLQNDQLNPSYDVKLRFKIEGSGIKIQTTQDFFSTPITLTNGVPELLNGFDMAPYLEANALQFQGITRDQYRRRAAIPDGFYKVCIQVFDYRTGIALSDEVCTTAWFILNDPPRLNLPACGDKLRPQDPTFMMFNWLGMQTSGGFGTEYVFQLFWIQPKGRNPNDLVLASANNPLYETTVSGTSLIYGPAEPPLFPGDQYAWRVQAKETFGRDLFKNNGYSQVCWFTYGDACAPPTDVEANVEGSQRATITWTAAPVTTKYRLDYREKNSLKWYTVYTVAEKATITDFKPATTYEYRVQSLCGVSYSEFTKTDTLRTRNPFANTVLSCGQSNNSPKVDTLLKLQTLRPGDEIMVGNFKLIISEASGGGGNFKGKGSMQISLINTAVLGEFENLKINSEYQVYSGVVNVRSGSIGLLPQEVKDKLNSYYSQIVTITDKLDNMLGDAQDLIDKGTSILDKTDKAIMTSQEYLDKVKKLQEDIQGYISAAEGGNKVGKVITGNTEATEKLSIAVSNASQISGTSNNGKCELKITGDDKTEQTISVVAPATIQDANGTIYAIDNACKAVKVAEQITLGKTPGELDALSNKAIVTFVDFTGKQKYAHSAWNQEYDKSPDEWEKRYQLLGSSYHVPARSIEPSATDFLKATDRKSTRLNSSHLDLSRMPSSA